MSSSRTPETTATEAQAAAWLIRLEGDPSPRTLAQWREWLTEDTRHHAVYVRIESGWRQTERLKWLRPLDGTVDPDVLSTFPGLQPSRPAQSTGFRPSAVRATFVGALALATMMLATWFHAPKAEHVMRRTELGGFSRTVLPDGSIALLNTNTEIQIRYNRSIRQVILTRGEAFFAVAHAEGRPFEVAAGATSVRAIGTSFVVRRVEPTNVEVLVSRGRVRVASDSASPPLVLTAGDDTKVDSRGQVATARADASEIGRRLAWTRGQIWLNETTLAEAIAEFNRYNSRKFVIADPALATLRVGGSFAATDPKAFVAALERVFGIRALSAQAFAGPEIISLFGPRSLTPGQAATSR
ncbi:MAG TPA: FecR domain-containing protein [Steroidobacteraceae bacterium]